MHLGACLFFTNNHTIVLAAGVLGDHLEELFRDAYCCHDLLPLLPAAAKACLLAVARLRRLLNDAALLALADEGQTVLDLAGAGAALSDGGIRQALRRMPHLRQADLTSCPVGAATLRALGECCPAVELLRLGSPVTDSASTARWVDANLAVLAGSCCAFGFGSSAVHLPSWPRPTVVCVSNPT